MKTARPSFVLAFFITLTLLVAGAAQAALQTAGQLLIDLHVGRGLQTNAIGTVLNWTNYGTVPGVFAVDGTADTAPTNNMVSGQGSVTFDGAERLKASFVAPDMLTGVKPGNVPEDYTVEYWVYNPAVATEEWLLSIARRGTSPRFAGFGYGTSAAFGVTAHWGNPDMGFGEGVSTAGAASTPPAGYWQHIVVTYDGTTEKAYTNGVLNAQEAKALNLWVGDPVTLGMTYTYSPLAYQSGIGFSGSLKALRVHAGALTAEQVLNNYLEGMSAIGAVPFQVAPLAATGIWTTNATMNGRLQNASTPADVTIFYGPTDYKTNKSQWAGSVYVGQLGSGNFSTNVTGLSFGTTYYYRAYVSNETGEAWSTSMSLLTLGLPSIANLAPKTVMPTYARLRGNLTSTNGSSTQVRVYWGATDGGTTVENWANVVDLGTQAVGDLAVKVSNLTPGTTYYYRFYAVNAAGVAWAASSQSFTTPAVFSPMGFGYNMQINFSGYTKTEVLTNFPALVVLSSNIANFSYANFLSGTADLRFVEENGGELNYEIETWDPNGSSYIWVQVPELTSSTVIQAFWGKAGLTAAPNYTTNGATWNDGFVAVWHMTNRLPTDASGHNWNAISNRNPNAVTTTAGVIGYGQDFATNATGGVAGTTVIGNGGDIDLTTQTMSAWVWLRDANREGAFMAKDGVMFFWQQGAALRFETANWGGDTTLPNPPTGTWIHFAATASGDGSVQRLYTNGVLVAGPWTKGAPVLNNNIFTIGGGYVGNDNRAHNGKLDECRAENVARSVNWLWASWKNQSAPSQFATLGSVAWLGAPLAVSYPQATGVGQGNATLSAKLISDGGNGASAWGFAVGSSPAPTDIAATLSGSANAPMTFRSSVSGLTAATHYYFRGWASNAVEGIQYSADGEFYTKPDAGSALVLSGAANNSMTLSWTAPAAYTGFLVVMREAVPVTAVPQDGVAYTASSVFERGSDLGAAQYVVYADSGTSVTVSGLVPGATYYAAVYAYCGAGSLINYQSVNPATGSQVTTSTVGFGVAGQLLIDINVLRGLQSNNLGQITGWTNYGTAGGSFAQDGADSTCPVFTNLNGVPTIGFGLNGANHLKSTFMAPAEITGLNPQGQPDDYSMEMWTLNPAVADQEWLFSWGWRGTAPRCAAFGYGYNSAYGALGHWGAADVAFSGGVPPAGLWHHIVATYDGTNNYIYVDGVLNTTKANALNIWDGGPCVLGDQYNMPFGYANVPYSGYVTTLRVHSRCMTPQQVSLNYSAGPLDPQAPVSLVVQPQSLTVGELATVTFSVVAAGAPPISYQWFRNGVEIPGATGNSYTLPGYVTTADSGAVFSVLCSNTAGGVGYSATSANASLTVISANDALMHRYSFNGNGWDLVGGADAMFMNGATNDGSAVVLDGVSAFVDLPNDLFTNYTSLTVETWATENGSGGWARLWDFGNSNAGEGQGGTGVNYMFFAWPTAAGTTVRGAYKLSTTGEQYAEGTRPSTGVKHHIVWTQDGGQGTAAIYIDGVRVTLAGGFTFTPAAVGSTLNNWLARSQFGSDAYWKGSIDEFRIYNIALSSNQVYSSYTSGPDAAISIGPARLLTQPISRTIGEYGDASFSVFVRGEAPLSYQWYMNESAVAGAEASSFTFPNVQVTNSGSQFYCVVSNYANGTPTVLTSAVATLTVIRAFDTMTHRYSFTTDASDSIGTAHGTLLNGTVVSNGQAWFVAAQSNYVELPSGLINGYSNITVEFWINAGSNANWARVFDFGDQVTNTVGHHYFFFTPHSSYLDARMSIADGDPVGSSHEQIVRVPSVLDNQGMTHVACVWDQPNSTGRLYTNGVLAGSGGITIPLSNINNVVSWLGRSLFAVDGWYNGSIDEFRIYNAALSSGKILQSYQQGPDFPLVDSQFLIVQQPASQTVEGCSTVRFQVRAGSPYPISYQWYWFGFPIADETNSSLSISNVQDYLAGEYYVEVTTALGLLTSETATLAVQDTTPPTIVSYATNITLATDAECRAVIPDLSTNVVATDCSGVTITQTPPVGTTTGLGSQTVTFTLQDALGHTAICTATLTVVDGFAPLIGTEPLDGSVLAGTDAFFTVAASSCGPVSYQWYFDATNALTGATGATLSIPNVQAANAGEYTVVVANSGGTVTSRAARLTVIVNRPPVAQNDGATTTTNQPLTIAAATLLNNDTDPDGNPLSVISVTANSTQGGSVTLAGEQVTYTPATGFAGVDQFSYTISDGQGGTATADVTVFVAEGRLPVLHGLVLTRVAQGWQIRFLGTPGTSYRFLSTEDLFGTWSSVATQVAPAHGLIEIIDTNSASGLRFYKSVTP